jgi:hypothetical protein
MDAYARAVVAGKVLAGTYHRLACVRHERDRAHEGTPDFPYVFDVARAERFFRFAERLKHYKSEWAGQLIRLQPHQRFRLGSIFAWVHMRTGLRRFRTAYNEIPRKNGKLLEAALVALYVTFFDFEAGAEGYCIATKREQAKISATRGAPSANCLRLALSYDWLLRWWCWLASRKPRIENQEKRIGWSNDGRFSHFEELSERPGGARLSRRPRMDVDDPTGTD